MAVTAARGVRKRFLISGFTQGTIKGAYIGVGSSAARCAAAREPGYSKDFAMDVIANIRTDLDAFSEVEQAVQMNHGYALMDAAIRTHAPELTARDAAFALPFPAFAPPRMGEEELRRRLAGSQKRKLTGGSAGAAAKPSTRRDIGPPFAVPSPPPLTSSRLFDLNSGRWPPVTDGEWAIAALS